MSKLHLIWIILVDQSLLKADVLRFLKSSCRSLHVFVLRRRLSELWFHWYMNWLGKLICKWSKYTYLLALHSIMGCTRLVLQSNSLSKGISAIASCLGVFLRLISPLRSDPYARILLISACLIATSFVMYLFSLTWKHTNRVLAAAWESFLQICWYRRVQVINITTYSIQERVGRRDLFLISLQWGDWLLLSSILSLSGKSLLLLWTFYTTLPGLPFRRRFWGLRFDSLDGLLGLLQGYGVWHYGGNLKWLGLISLYLHFTLLCFRLAIWLL